MDCVIVGPSVRRSRASPTLTDRDPAAVAAAVDYRLFPIGMFDSHQADGLGRAGGLVIAAGRTLGGVSDRANRRAPKGAPLHVRGAAAFGGS
jgi:hypothetical protein